MPENGFMTPAETAAEWRQAEDALKARRDPAQLAGELTPAEAKSIAAMDERLAAAVAANQAALRKVIAAREAIDYRGPRGGQAATLAEAERVLARSSREEEEARQDQMRLSVAIGAARQARRQEAAR